MTRARAWVAAALALVALVGVLTPAPSARAALSPASAEEDAHRALASGKYGFCAHPTKPLPARARDLCALAQEIPDCAGFAEACAGHKEEPAPSKLDLGWLGALLGAIGTVLTWALIAGVVVLLLYPVLRAILRARRDRSHAEPDAPSAPDAPEEAPVDEPPGETDAERLLAHAEALAREGRLDRALFALLNASLRALDERGAIRIERYRTNGEYVRACAEPAAKRTLRELVRAVDRVKFGGARPDASTVAWARERAVALVRMAPIALLALFFVGCGARVPQPTHDDPSEDALLLDVLERQGARVGRLSGSLATLPIPAADGPATPVVVVDAERVPLSDDARARLAAWVDAGGALVLAGSPRSWPKELAASSLSSASGVVTLGEPPHATDDDEGDDEDDRESPAVPSDAGQAHLARGEGFAWDKPATQDRELAHLANGSAYASLRALGKGRALGLGSDDLLTNAGLARPGNARALVTLFAALGRNDFRVARPEDGITPPTNPVSSLVEAGLGKGLVHALVATALLFLAAGVRSSRARPTPAPARRAFAEHVEATGALYARTRVAGHALAAYARYAESALRASMPRGAADPAAFLAARTGADAARCAALWARAMDAASPDGDPAPLPDDMLVLRDLSALVTAATKRA